MPELVEVENYRQLLLSLKRDTNSSSPSLLTVETPSPTTPKIFPSESELDFVKKCAVEDVERKGKLLCLVLRSGGSKSKSRNLYLHMGMSGRISTPDNIPSLESLNETDTFPPPHTHLILESNGKQVSYSDPRRFGTVGFGEPISSQWEEFAPDALDPEASLEKLIQCKKGVKALLLDQRAIISGVGNWIADEILYQSKIHPDQNYLTTEEVGVLKECLDLILKKGIECLAKKESFPNDWIFHRRWSKGKGGGNQKDANDRTITFLKSAGRTSAIVPSIQKKQSRRSSTNTQSTDKDNSFQAKRNNLKCGDHQQNKRKNDNSGVNRRQSKRLISKET